MQLIFFVRSFVLEHTPDNLLCGAHPPQMNRAYFLFSFDWLFVCILLVLFGTFLVSLVIHQVKGMCNQKLTNQLKKSFFLHFSLKPTRVSASWWSFEQMVWRFYVPIYERKILIFFLLHFLNQNEVKMEAIPIPHKLHKLCQNEPTKVRIHVGGATHHTHIFVNFMFLFAILSKEFLIFFTFKICRKIILFLKKEDFLSNTLSVRLYSYSWETFRFVYFLF